MRSNSDHPDNILASLSSELQVHSRKESPDRFVVKKAPMGTYFYFTQRYAPVFYKTWKKVKDMELTSLNFESHISEKLAGSYSQCINVQSQYDVDIAFAYKESIFFADAKVIKSTIGELTDYIKFLKLRVPLLLSSDELSEQARKSLENSLRFYKEWFSLAFLKVIHLLTTKYESKKGIGRGVEGYIPFVTWARGSLRSQLVNSLVLPTS